MEEDVVVVEEEEVMVEVEGRWWEEEVEVFGLRLRGREKPKSTSAAWRSSSSKSVAYPEIPYKHIIFFMIPPSKMR